jgi:hypothetical protein
VVEREERIESGSPPPEFAWRIKARFAPGGPDWKSQNDARSVRAMMAMIPAFRPSRCRPYVYVKPEALLLSSRWHRRIAGRKRPVKFPLFNGSEASPFRIGRAGPVASFPAQADRRIHGHHRNAIRSLADLSERRSTCRRLPQPQDLDRPSASHCQTGAIDTTTCGEEVLDRKLGRRLHRHSTAGARMFDSMFVKHERRQMWEEGAAPPASSPLNPRQIRVR